MKPYLKLWSAFAVIVVASFAVLGYYGVEIYRQAPPIPAGVAEADGAVLFTGQDIRDGQNVWQSMGGQEVGSIWGHGAYVAPDWSALTLKAGEVLNLGYRVLVHDGPADAARIERASADFNAGVGGGR